MMDAQQAIITVTDVKNYLGGCWVHEGLNFEVRRGEIVAIIGSSGCGKTTLLRSILMLRRQTAGHISVFDVDTVASSAQQQMSIRKRWGVMFQSAALFSSLTLLENVIFPMTELTNLSRKLKKELAMLKIQIAGLDGAAALKYPAELSGGMKKRAALARAIALDPELLFLDEPTAGLDPKSAGELDSLVLEMRDNLGLTFVMVTHDLDTLWRVPDRILFMGEGKVLAYTTMAEMVKQTHPLIVDYFSGPRHQHQEQDDGRTR
ncbi:MAG: ABC transporter ATP-binding protein [Coxiella sp. (in: Bacteria)]|nr:MAG: ABC transporter ATP-binding protein [Coxiella sp. (in: g-proteobacteria)]